LLKFIILNQESNGSFTDEPGVQFYSGNFLTENLIPKPAEKMNSEQVLLDSIFQILQTSFFSFYRTEAGTEIPVENNL
jgi:hypothetical protein